LKTITSPRRTSRAGSSAFSIPVVAEEKRYCSVCQSPVGRSR
jgi:hypothetical protein